MRKLLTVILCLHFLPSLAQDKTEEYQETIFKQLKAFPQEKIHMQTDKKAYVIGEDIWYRMYVIDAILHTPSPDSRYVYVDLISPSGELISQSKIKPVDSAFHNSINLADTLAEGTYLLRAYTNFMRNSPDYFFEKKLFVADPQSLTLHMNPQFIIQDNKVLLKFDFLDSQNNPVEIKRIAIRVDSEKTKRTSSEKEFKFDYTPDKQQVVYLEFEHDDKLYKKYIAVPTLENNFDVSFFPEGGYLVENQRCKVGFKALKTTGLSEEIEGELYDDSDNLLITFKTAHAGMGSFLLHPEVRKSYYVICKNEKGITRRFDIPAARNDLCMLRTVWNRNKLYISLQNGEKFPHNINDLTILIQLRGMVIYASEWASDNNIMNIDKDLLPSGVIQILLLDPNNEPLSERLVFNYNKDEFPVAEISTDKPNYNKREKVSVRVNLSDTLAGSFSVSVTDNKDILPDTTFSIISNLLLVSELKGYIESPEYYLHNAQTADALMLTQGWRRYNIPAVLKSNLVKPTHYMELGQEFSGTVKNLLTGKPLAERAVSIFSNEYFNSTLTNQNGKFYFNGFELPDSTTYILQALSKRGTNNVELVLDELESLQPIESFAIPNFMQDESFKDYMEKADLKYINEHGMRVTLLKAVTVVGHKPDTRKKSIYSSIAGSVLEANDIEQAGGNIFNALMRMPGVWVSGEKVSIRGNTPIIILDDVIIDIEMLSAINAYDVDNIEVIKGAESAIFGSGGGGGAILIMTKTGEASYNWKNYNIKAITPKGYKKPIEFYAPKYETKEQINNVTTDLRTTIYWNPDVKFINGNAEFEFYTADTASTYSVVIEGVSDNGGIIKTEGIVNRN